MKFAICAATKTDHSEQSVACYCALNQIPYRVFVRPKDVPKDYTPIGPVDWVEVILGRHIAPDYYPEFLTPFLHRKVWREEKWPFGRRVFIKPSDRHKRFTGFVTTGTWKKAKRGPFWCSDVVQWECEWRYYVAAGKVLAANWCCGNQELPPPEISVQWPSDYYGAVDFGLLKTDEIALIEANGPFSCGWYGTLGDAAPYVEWLNLGWNFLTGTTRGGISVTNGTALE